MSISWRTTPVTIVLLGINIAIFLLITSLLAQSGTQEFIYYWFVNVPGYFSPGAFLSNFVHFEIRHLFSNMYMLYVLGPLLERYLGRYKYISLVVWTAVVAGAFIGRFATAPTLGFSGVVLGMIAFAYFYKPIPVQKQQLGILLLLNIVIGLSPGISFLGHAAGALGGASYARYVQR